MGKHDPGAITDRYDVVFWCGERGDQHRPSDARLTTVALTEGYTDFEHIRNIIGTRLGTDPVHIRVEALRRASS